jgi:hypothetical protein
VAYEVLPLLRVVLCRPKPKRRINSNHPGSTFNKVSVDRKQFRLKTMNAGINRIKQMPRSCGRSRTRWL